MKGRKETEEGEDKRKQKSGQKALCPRTVKTVKKNAINFLIKEKKEGKKKKSQAW